MNTIQAAWDQYRRNVIPPQAGELQVRESRRAFYAGAAAVLGIGWRIGDDDVTEEAGVAMLQTLSDEIEGFYRDVGKGRA